MTIDQGTIAEHNLCELLDIRENSAPLSIGNNEDISVNHPPGVLVCCPLIFGVVQEVICAAPG
jgi:hypothetical protein